MIFSVLIYTSSNKIINIKIVNDVYKIKILAACFKISELLNDIKFVKVFLKLSS